MKNRALQGCDSYPSILTGIKGGKLRSREFRSKSGEAEYNRSHKKKEK
jgi:hypothetical protein